jgi:ankyrin repeat protein
LRDILDIKEIAYILNAIPKYISFAEYARKVLNSHREKVSSYEKERKSRAFDAAMQVVQAHKTVLLTGKLGSGKTHTALNIMNNLIDAHPNFHPVIACSPYDITVLENSSTDVVVLLDDCLGLNNNHVGGWRRTEKLTKALLERKQAFFILTAENCVFDCAMDVENGPGIPFIRGITRIDLESDAFRLTAKEQVSLIPNISQNKQKLYSIKDSLYDICSEFDNQFVGFPIVCSFMGSRDIETLFKDPFKNISELISEIRENNFAAYTGLLLMLLLENGFKIAGLPNTDKTVFLKLLELFKHAKCTYADVLDSFETLAELNLVVKDASRLYYTFKHRLVYMAVLRDITRCKFDDILDLLPVHAVNSITFKVPNHEQTEEDRNAHNDIKVTINLLQSHLNVIASKFSSAIESKKASVFKDVASSHMWRNEQFAEKVMSTIGPQFFFQEDMTTTPLSVYLIRCGQYDLLCNVYTAVTQTGIAMEFQSQLARTIEEAIRDRNKSLLTRYSKLYAGNESSIVQAAIDTGDTELFTIVLNPAGPFRNSMAAIVPSACASANTDIVKYLLTQLGQDLVTALLRKKDSEGRTLLHFAAKGGSVEIFDFLLDLGLDLKAQTKLDVTVLDIAAIHGRLNLVKHIVSLVPDMVEVTDHHGFTVAHYAAREGNFDILKHVVTHGASATLKVQGGNTIFHLAAFNGHVSILDYLMDTYPGIITIQNDDSFLPVHLSAKSGQTETVDFFFRRGTDKNIRTIDGRSLLHIAAFNGNFQLVRHLCTKYPECIKYVDNDGNTPAHDAAASGNIKTLEYLLDNHIDPHICSRDGCTLLHEACYYCRNEVMKYLATNFPKMLHSRSNNGYSCCHAAALGGSVEILDFLIRSGADPAALSEDGSTILHEAAFSGKLNMVKYISDHCPEMFEIVNVRSYLAIHFAAQEGHLDILIHILSIREGSIPTTNENQTILHIAAYNGRMNIVKYICDKHADIVCMKDANAALATHYAARGGFMEVLDYLLSKGQDPFATTTSGSTILHLAAFDGKLDAVKHICNKYPELLHKLDNTGHDVAHYGAGSGNLDLLKFVIEQGLEPLAVTSNGSTLLLKAAVAGKLEMVKFICSSYPDMIKICDEFGCNALHYSVCGGYIDVLQYLCTLGLDPMTKTNDGHTLLHIASYHGQLEMVIFLCQEYPDLRNVTDGLGQTPDKFAQLGEQYEVLKYFKKDKRKSGVAQTVVERLPVCGDGCCGSVYSVFGRFVGIICFCRRNK